MENHLGQFQIAINADIVIISKCDVFLSTHGVAGLAALIMGSIMNSNLILIFF